ncbi:MAG TPA: roadblock/LC7 domain-containing protein [Candidatus Latescibacteria bacterium]|nr:roadblock/LC7 domain-containing protein [Candidatus Latescibacterota bacterium]
MSGATPQALDKAFQVVDAVTRLKGVTGALLIDPDGSTIAQDFRSDDDLKRASAIGTTLPFELTKAAKSLKMGLVSDLTIQTVHGALRVCQNDGIWLLVFIGPRANLGMLNIEMRAVRELFASVFQDDVKRGMDAEKQRILEVIESTGSVDSVIDKRRGDLKAMRMLHEMVFRIAIDAGIGRETISRTINDINYRIYRDSLVDIGFDFFNRKALDTYDPALAERVMEEQIKGIAGLVTAQKGKG